uniref:Uncharacterized protein n=1 Tax=Schizaphis graminum TaxID=13262 RepID=A0A2S2PJ48_SCHGA
MVEIKLSMFYNKRLLITRTIILFMLALITLSYVNMINFSKKDPIPTVSNADCSDNKFTSSRLVWPEQLPRGDRILEQMYYVPKGYKYLKTPIKRILIYTGPGASWEVPKLDQAEFFGCPMSQC